MRHIFIIMFTLFVAGGIARAQDYSINTIVGYVDIAERRLNEGDANSARSNLENARQMMPGASAEAKADKRWAGLPDRIAKLDKLIAAKEQANATVEQGTEKFREADKEEMYARIELDQDNWDKATDHYKACLKDLEDAAAIDPTVKQRESQSSKSFDDLTTTCKQGITEMQKLASGVGRNVEQTEQGKAALEGYQAAMKAMTSKKLTTMEASAGIKGAEDCDHNANTLTATYLRNGKHMWPGDTTKLAGITLDELAKKCAKMVHEISAKPAYGCGRHFVDVSQDRASIYDHWGRVKASGKMPWDAVECSEMPKKSVLRGRAAGYKAMYQASCGADAIFIITSDDWLEDPTHRQMSGDCYRKGTLNVNK